MRALVTGSSGFLGRHYVAALVGAGWDVRGVDLAALDPSERGHPGTFYRGHAEDVLRAWLQSVDLAVHCAAVVGGRQGIESNPLALATANLTIDAAVFDWCARTRPGRLLYVSSSAVYPTHLQTWDQNRRLREDDARPDDPWDLGTPDATYGWVKLTGEKLCTELRELGVPVTIVRPFSGYGTDQSPDYPFRAFIDRAKAKADPFEMWANGHQVRDWIHVDDVVRLSLELCRAGATGPVNLCSGVPLEMFDLARIITGQADHLCTLKVIDGPMGVEYRVGDPSLMRNLVGPPRVQLAEGIRRALAGEV